MLVPAIVLAVLACFVHLSSYLQRWFGLLIFTLMFRFGEFFDAVTCERLDPLMYYVVDRVPAYVKHASVKAVITCGALLCTLFPALGVEVLRDVTNERRARSVANGGKNDQLKIPSAAIRFLELGFLFKDAFRLSHTRVAFFMRGVEALWGSPSASTPVQYVPEAGSRGSYWVQCVGSDMKDGPVLLWFYAGAFIAGEAESYTGFMSDLGRAAGVNGLLVRYRTPSIAEALEDAISAYQVCRVKEP
jgi:acetyl esterase/lipase